VAGLNTGVANLTKKSNLLNGPIGLVLGSFNPTGRLEFHLAGDGREGHPS
jgi:hypothetical protein